MHHRFCMISVLTHESLTSNVKTKTFGGYKKKKRIWTQSGSFTSSLTCWWVSFWPDPVKTHMSWSLYVIVRCKQREKSSVQITLFSHNAAVCMNIISKVCVNNTNPGSDFVLSLFRQRALQLCDFFCFTFLLMRLMFFLCVSRTLVSRLALIFAEQFFFFQIHNSDWLRAETQRQQAAAWH